MGARFKNIGIVSMLTVGSRLLGLVRDVLIFAALGAGVWSSAFILAFTLPNLFRRLLGEGALTSALVPVLSEALEEEGLDSAFTFFNQVLTRLAAILLGIVILGIMLMLCCVELGVLPARWIAGAKLSALLFPYMIFICLAAVVSAALQILGRFTLASLTPVVLNLSMIAGLAYGILAFDDTPERIVAYLCFGVLIGGLLQMLLPVMGLQRLGWRLKLHFESSSHLRELWRLFLPGLVGAAILQLNILVSRLLAYSLDESAASILYIGSRLMELPLGVFTIAVITVYFPLLATTLSRGDRRGFEETFNEGASLIMSITIPAGVGLTVLGGPILDLLFNWGAFDSGDVTATLPVLITYAIGLPFYSLATFATRGFHANKDMRSPVRVACICLFVNAVSGVFLMKYWGAVGLAVGNVIAAIVQSYLLFFGLGVGSHIRRVLAKSILKVAAASACMGLACYLGLHWLDAISGNAKLDALICVGFLVPIGGLVYLGVLSLVKGREVEILRNLLLRKKNRSAQAQDRF